MSLDSEELARRLAANPHNVRGVEGAPPMPNHDYWAARFEDEGRLAHPAEPNPYLPGTMAHGRWARGRERTAIRV